MDRQTLWSGFFGLQLTLESWQNYLYTLATTLDTVWLIGDWLAGPVRTVASWVIYAKYKIWLVYDGIIWVLDSIPAFPSLSEIQDWVIEKLNNASNALAAALQTTSDWLVVLLNNASDALAASIQATSNWLAATIQGVSDWAAAKIQQTSDWLYAELYSIRDALSARIQAVWDQLGARIQSMGAAFHVWIQAVWDQLLAKIQQLSNSYNPLQLAALWALYAALTDMVNSLYAALKLFVHQDYPVVKYFLNNPALFVWDEVKRRIEDATWRQFSSWKFPPEPLGISLPNPRDWLFMKVDNYTHRRENWTEVIGAVEARWKEMRIPVPTQPPIG